MLHWIVSIPSFLLRSKWYHTGSSYPCVFRPRKFFICFLRHTFPPSFYFSSCSVNNTFFFFTSTPLKVGIPKAYFPLYLSVISVPLKVHSSNKYLSSILLSTRHCLSHSGYINEQNKQIISFPHKIKYLCYHRYSKPSSPKYYGFSSSNVWMWELDHKESWTPKNWCFWTMVLEKTLESPLETKEIKPVNPKQNQSWIFTGRAEYLLKRKLQYSGHLMWRADSLEKTLTLGKIEAGGEGKDIGWDGRMASLTWVWASSTSWWWTGRPGMLQSMGSRRVGHDWATELNWNTILNTSLPNLKKRIWSDCNDSPLTNHI